MRSTLWLRVTGEPADPQVLTSIVDGRPLTELVAEFESRQGYSPAGGYAGLVEPPIGIEPMTYALRGARSLTGDALAAALAWIIALTALAALGLSGMPFHKPFHARGSYPATA